MSRDVPSQPQYLTLIESALNYGLFGGVGYLMAGSAGLWCGTGLITLLYGRLIWFAATASRPGNDAAATPDA